MEALHRLFRDCISERNMYIYVQFILTVFQNSKIFQIVESILKFILENCPLTICSILKYSPIIVLNILFLNKLRHDRIQQRQMIQINVTRNLISNDHNFFKKPLTGVYQFYYNSSHLLNKILCNYVSNYQDMSI